MEIKQLELKDLIPYANNPRKKQAVDKVASSLKEFGWQQPIVVNEENVIIAGHTRYQAAQKLGFTKVPVQIAKGLTDAQVKAYRILDNRANQDALWDDELLKIEVQDLDKMDIDLSLTGFDDKELDKLLYEEKKGLTDEDAVPENVEPRVKQGELWQLGNHRLLCGDSTNKADVDRLMNNQLADLLLTDPPYGIGYGGSMKLGQKKHGWKQYKGGWDEARPSNQWIDNSFKITTNQIVWGGNYFTDLLPPKMGWLIWDKGQRNFSMADGEMAWTSFDKALRIKTVHRAEALKDGKVHPTQKSIELLIWSIVYNDRNTKTKAKIIMDLFLGSGSTLIACEKTNRSCYGLELDPKYCDIIIKRWENYTGQTAQLLERGTDTNSSKEEKQWQDQKNIILKGTKSLN